MTRRRSAMHFAPTIFVLILLLPGAVEADDRPIEPTVTILSTMVANYLGVGEWGFSALIEADDEAILFDTGFKPRTVLENARLLGIDLSTVRTVVLSHFHTDHTGGLLTLRREFMSKNPNALTNVYVGEGFFRQRYDRQGVRRYSLRHPLLTESFQTPQEFRAAAEALGIVFTVISEATEIRPGIFLSGPIPRVHDERNVSPGSFLKTESGKLLADTIPESQVLGLTVQGGWLLVSGCGHAGLVNAMEHLHAIEAQPVRGAVGGFHLFRADADTLTWTGRNLARFGVERFIGAHCTGAHATHALGRQLELPRSSVSIGAVGTKIEANLTIARSSID